MSDKVADLQAKLIELMESDDYLLNPSIDQEIKEIKEKIEEAKNIEEESSAKAEEEKRRTVPPRSQQLSSDIGTTKETKKGERTLWRKYTGPRTFNKISPDDVLACIRTVQRGLGIPPEALQELFRLAYLRCLVLCAFAQRIYPDFPMLIEWSMLRKLMHGWFLPITCLQENVTGKFRGEPNYKATCFRPGTVLPGANGKNLYVATGRKQLSSSDPKVTATDWVILRTATSGTGFSIAQRMLDKINAEDRTARNIDNRADDDIWQYLQAASNEATTIERNTDIEQARAQSVYHTQVAKAREQKLAKTPQSLSVPAEWWPDEEMFAKSSPKESPKSSLG